MNDSLPAIVKSTVSPAQVAEAFGIEVDRHNRCACPIHHGKDHNMRLGERGYHCFVCGAHGDVFEFVRAMNQCSFPDALAWLNETFALDLPLNRKPSRAEIEASKRAREEARRQREEQHELDMVLFETYVDVQKCIGELQDDAERYRPKPNDETWDERYGRAMTLLPQMNDMAEALLTKMSERRNK